MDAAQNGWVERGNIGEGGFGVVKLFENEALKLKVVLKECRRPSMSQDFVERWYQELDLVKRLCHPNIVQAIDLPSGFTHQALGGMPYICMEFCEEGDLRKVLKKPDNCCGLREDQIRNICGDINQGIIFLHSQKVIHRDLKPENILLKRAQNGQLVYKLTDFGYSKSYDLNSMCTSLVGTMQYVAPEVMQSKKYHSSVDFWSFGVVVFECITGRRPFLHGAGSNSIMWVDCVSKKNPDVIYIYFKQDSSGLESSSHLPGPHRLSKNLEALLTSWLQTALHYDSEKRGSRRRPGEDAVCLSNMDHILSTRMVNTTCMSTASELSFNIDNTTTYRQLGALIEEQQPRGDSSDFRQLLMTSNGKIPSEDRLVVEDMQSAMERVYVFTSTFEPSFRLMQTSNQAVTDLTAYGDGKFPYNVLKDLYSKVFFHIKENLSFFRNLYDGQGAILDHISDTCDCVRRQQCELESCVGSTTEVLDMVREMHSKDMVKLEESMEEGKVSHNCECYDIWRASELEMDEHRVRLETIQKELKKILVDSESYFSIAKELLSVHTTMDKMLDEYRLKHVESAHRLYEIMKKNQSRMVSQPKPSMQDILLEAQDDAQKIIERCLNGRNYGQLYWALHCHRDKIAECTKMLTSIKSEVRQLNDTRRGDIWEIIVKSKRDSPTSSLYIPYNKSRSRMSEDSGNDGIAMAAIVGSVPGRKSSAELRQQISSISTTSVDSVCDPTVTQSLVELQRRISEEDNSALISKNRSLRTKYQELVRSMSASEPLTNRQSSEESKR